MSWGAYEEAVAHVRTTTGWLSVHPVETDVGNGVSGPFPDVEGGAVHIVTAYNPHGATPSDSVNREADQQLKGELQSRGLAFDRSYGADASWTHVEAGVVVQGMSDDQARELGRTFGQDAIIRWTPMAWTLLSCATRPDDVGDTATRVSRGFRSAPLSLDDILPGPRDDDTLSRLCSEAGASETVTDSIVGLGLDPRLIVGDIEDAAGFLSAAIYKDLDRQEVELYLDLADGDPQEAWQVWGEVASEDPEDDNETG